MNRNEILSKLKDILVGVRPQTREIYEKIDENSCLATELGLNSIGMLCLVISTEEAFGIDFGNVQFNDFKYVRDVVSFIEEKKDDKK